MTKRDFYEVLGVEKTATEDEIKKAYRKIAMENHPDRNPDNKEAEERFKEAAEAYETLNDPNKKANYDKFGHAGQQREQYSDMFADFMNRHGFNSNHYAQPIRRRGGDLNIKISLTLEEIYSGVVKNFTYKRNKACDTCAGKGGMKSRTCGTCNGAGNVIQPIRMGGGMIIQQTIPCTTCEGIGQIIEDTCQTCNGKGTKLLSEELSLDIPYGVFDGLTMIIENGGNAVKCGDTGKLLVLINEIPHKIFTRSENDLVMKLKLSYSQLVLGDEIELTMIDGKKVKIKIPEYSKPNNNLRLKDKGLKILQQETFGVLNVVLDIDMPTNLDDDKRKLIEQLK